MIVRVYYNLHKKCLSVQYKTIRGWRLLTYAHSLELTEVIFKVYEAGRKRVLNTKRKNVHAFIIGNLKNIDTDVNKTFRSLEDICKSYKKEYYRVVYNPYKFNAFIIDLNNPIYKADSVYIEGKNIISSY